MSLQLAAKHLESHGRGDDKVLVHMTKGEVKSLNDLAMAHGGQLTINPQTGLPEAGFLSAILPMVAGAGLMLIPGMQASAAGLIVGGLQTARTGSLSKGIMAGLGAYGGAGLAESAGVAGASSMPPTPTATPIAPTPAPVIPDGVTNFGPSASADAFSMTPTTPAITPSASLPQSLQDYGPVGQYTGSSAPLPTSTGGMNVTAPAPPQGIQAAAPVSEQASVRAIDNAVIPKDFNAMTASERAQAIRSGASFSNAGNFIATNPKTAIATGASIAAGMQKDPTKVEPDKDMGQRYSYSANTAQPLPAPDVPTYEDMLTRQGNFGRQQNYFTPSYTPINPTQAKDLYRFAGGGPVEQMSNNAMTGVNSMYPMANMTTSAFATPYQTPTSTNMLATMNPSSGGTVNMMSGEPNMQGTRLAEGGEAEESRPSYTYDAKAQKYMAGPSMGGGAGIGGAPISYAGAAGNAIVDAWNQMHPEAALGGGNGVAPSYAYNPQTQQYIQQMAKGGISDLGDYSDGGRLLRGPGDGVSDSIPAMIGKKQPARLADGEFVVPARIVSELGNGSTDAGARKLYAMMDRIQSARKKTVGKDKVAHNSRASKYLPA